MDAFGMGLVAAMGALATVAGASEDIDSDIGSQSNPNSQVQLAAQVGNPHRIYNKAIAGEPPSNALWCTTAAIMAYVLIEGYGMPLLFAAAAGASLAALFDGVMSVSAYLGRNASQARFNQWIYLDIIRYTTPSIMAHVWITSFCIVLISIIQVYVLTPHHPFPIPVIALVRSAEAAGDAGKLGGFDVVISDFRLPGEDGLSLLRRVRLASKTVITVLVTAYGNKDVPEKLERAGIDGYISKPISTEELESALLRLAGKGRGGNPGVLEAIT